MLPSRGGCMQRFQLQQKQAVRSLHAQQPAIMPCSMASSWASKESIRPAVLEKGTTVPQSTALLATCWAAHAISAVLYFAHLEAGGCQWLHRAAQNNMSSSLL